MDLKIFNYHKIWTVLKFYNIFYLNKMLSNFNYIMCTKFYAKLL
jgi:hypothetical protein